MILTIELVPSTSWYSNLRNSMSPADWDKLRKSVYQQYGYRCGICGASGQMECHEVWEYDNKHHIQTLKGFIALCSMCHHVKHIGLSGILAREGKLDFQSVVDHFVKVNQCTAADFEVHHKEAFRIWTMRSKFKWTVDLGQYVKLITGMKK